MFTEYLTMMPLSPLEKCFLDEDLSSHTPTDRFTAFRGETVSFQVAVHNAEHERTRPPQCRPEVTGPLAPYATVRQVMHVPAEYPTSYVGYDTDMLREKPCLCPDPIRPLHYNGQLPLPQGLTETLWIDVSVPETLAAGEYPVTVKLSVWQEEKSVTVTVCVADAVLPKQKLIHTEWFHVDCIAEGFHVKPYSEKHWTLIDKYLRCAVRNGINMILTPALTPELDTYMGGYRMCTQLTDVTVTGKDKYEFGFARLDRYIDLCLAAGVEYFEIPHFFSQWGPFRAVQVEAKVNGRRRRIFGWDDEALGEGYRAFLSQYIHALVAELKAKGVYERCFFHISDEPSDEHLTQYKKCRDFIAPLVGERPIIDALSHFGFYESGVLKKPVPAIKAIKPFLEAKVPGLWAYYCGNPPVQTGRCLTMNGYRTRILGVQLWLAGIEGFLHWGYNYYHNTGSYNVLDPLAQTGGEYMAPSGDTCVVYPGTDGEAWESVRLVALRDAVGDMRALDLLAERRGREYTEKILREVAGMEIDFENYPRENGFFRRLRERIAKEI